MLRKYIYVFLISMTPIVELRGAIPIGVGIGLDPIPLLILAIIGNMVPVPFIFFFARRFLTWGSKKKVIGKACTWCLTKGEGSRDKLEGKRGTGLYIALLLFVGIPLPGTGAWMGTFAASLLNMDFKKSFLYIIIGDAMAGVLVLLASMGVFGAIALI